MRSNSKSPPYTVVSAIEGRVRIQFARAPGYRRTITLVEARINLCPSVRRTRLAEDAASLIVEYDRARQSLGSCIDCLEGAIWDVLNADPERETCAASGRCPDSAARDRQGRTRPMRPASTALDVVFSIPGRIGIHIPSLHANGGRWFTFTSCC